MSYDKCKYCDSPAFKTDGNADPVCHNRAHSGDCYKNPQEGKLSRRERRAAQRKIAKQKK